MPNPVPGPHNLLNIDLDAIAENLQAVRGCLPQGVRVAGVVKSDAYGHGLVPVARKLKEAGAEFLAVAHADEGAILRREGLAGPIVLLLGIVKDQAAQAARLRLIPILQDFELIEALSGAAKSLGLKAQCHIKLDSGMGRLGLDPGGVMELIRRSSPAGRRADPRHCQPSGHGRRCGQDPRRKNRPASLKTSSPRPAGKA